MASRRRRKNNTNRNLTILALGLSLVLVALLVLAGSLPELLSTAPNPSPTIGVETTLPTAPIVTDPTQPPVVLESTATLSSTGDILMHGPVIKSGLRPNGEYDFSSIFAYFSSYVSASDFAVANLETTLAALNNGYNQYSGYPNFNCPDEIISGLKNSGFDLILTANNHSYDTRSIGLRRTQQVIQDMGLAHLGTKPAADAPNYFIADLNGIRIGMVCYTYEDDQTAEGKAPNSHKMTPEDAALINTFDYSNLPLFYEEMAQNMADMYAAGVDAVIAFIHWGDENALTPNAYQVEMAQGLCELGVDVIIGGHPHVVQPVELLTSSDGGVKTLCLYSMGNAVSNQNRVEVGIPPSGHTEDGVLFSVTFSKYSDGTVILTDTNILPLWVNRHYNSQGVREYPILPLDMQIEDWKTQFNLTDAGLKNALESYDRTMAIVGEGMTEAKAYLAQLQQETELALGIG